MEWLENLILKNLNLILVIAFILLPLIFSKKRGAKGRKPVQPFRKPTAPQRPAAPPKPTVPSKPTPPGRALENSLESKVRRFFEEMVEGADPTRTSRPPTASSPAPAGAPRAPVSLEDLAEAGGAPAGPGPVRGKTPAAAEAEMWDRKGEDSAYEDGRHQPAAATVPDDKDPYLIESKSPPPEYGPGAPGSRAAGKPSRRFLDGEKEEDLEEMRKILAARGKLPETLGVASFRNMSRGDLRRAIVLKEILDSPVAFKM